MLHLVILAALKGLLLAFIAAAECMSHVVITYW
jgi:hypothetical protein